MPQEPGAGIEQTGAQLKQLDMQKVISGPEQKLSEFERSNNESKKKQAQQFIEDDIINRFSKDYDARQKEKGKWLTVEEAKNFVNEKKDVLTDVEKRVLEGSATIEEAERVRSAYRAKANLISRLHMKNNRFFSKFAGKMETYGLSEDQVASWNIEQTEAWIKQKGGELQGEEKVSFIKVINNHSNDPLPIVYKDEEDYRRVNEVIRDQAGSWKKIHTLYDGSHFIETEIRGHQPQKEPYPIKPPETETGTETVEGRIKRIEEQIEEILKILKKGGKEPRTYPSPLWPPNPLNNPPGGRKTAFKKILDEIKIDEIKS